MTDDPRPDGAAPAGEPGAAVPDGASGESAPPRRQFLAEAPARLRFLNIAAALGLVALLFFVLVVGRDFLVPFVVAVAIWYLMIALKESFKQSAKYTHVPVPNAIATILAIATTVLAITLIVVLINSSINGVIASIPKYQDRINDIIGNSLKLVGYEGENPLREFIANLRPQEYVSRAAGAIGGLVQDMGLIIVYVLFLLLETWTFRRKLNALARSDTHRENLRSTIREIGEDINTYMRIKTWLSRRWRCCATRR